MENAGGRVDIMHYHIGTSNDLTSTWEVAEEYYRQIMRDPSSINFVTILREPREHFLSYYYYFVNHKIGHVSLELWVRNYFVRHEICSNPREPFPLMYWPVVMWYSGMKNARERWSVIPYGDIVYSNIRNIFGYHE